MRERVYSFIVHQLLLVIYSGFEIYYSHICMYVQMYTCICNFLQFYIFQSTILRFSPAHTASHYSLTSFSFIFSSVLSCRSPCALRSLSCQLQQYIVALLRKLQIIVVSVYEQWVIQSSHTHTRAYKYVCVHLLFSAGYYFCSKLQTSMPYNDILTLLVFYLYTRRTYAYTHIHTYQHTYTLITLSGAASVLVRMVLLSHQPSQAKSVQAKQSQAISSFCAT